MNVGLVVVVTGLPLLWAQSDGTVPRTPGTFVAAASSPG